MSKLFWIVLTCLAMASCQKFRSKFSGLTLQCGMEAHGDTVVQVLDPDGLGLSTTEGNVKAHWLPREASTGRQTLSLNRSGCTRLPDEAGVLEVSARLPAGAVRRVYEKSRATPYEQLKLIPAPSLSIQSRCFEGMTYARDQMFFPFTSNRSGNFASLQIALLARPVSGGEATLIWQKPFDEPQLEFPPQLDVSALAEGQYDLFMQWQDVATEEPVLSSSCAVGIRRKVPVLTGFPLASQPRVRTLAQGTILPWTSRNAEDTLGLCRKQLASEARELPDAACSRPDQFQPAQLIIADQPGLWEYCLIAEDKAGNRSAPYCEQLLISPSGPDIQVAWQHPDLKGPLPLLKRPYAHLEAKIQLKHPLLTPEQLQKNLQCKVEIAVNADIHASGSKVLCMNGPCAGEDLGEFRSCPGNLTLDLTGLWAQPLQRRARLQLMVRADDGAGQTVEAQADAWIHDKAWYAEPMTHGNSGLPEDDEPVQVELDRQGRIWLLTLPPSKQPRIYLRTSSKWQLSLEFPEPEGLVLSDTVQDLFQDETGTLYASGEDASGQLAVFQKNEDDTWQALPAPDFDQAAQCTGFVGMKQGFSCVTAFHILQWRPTGWTVIDRPKKDGEPLCQTPDNSLVVDGERIWSPCGGLLYLYEGGFWQRKLTPEIDAIEMMRRDSRGRIWVQTRFPFYANNGIGYFDPAGEWHPTGVQAGLPESILGSKMLTFGADQRLYYGPYVWNEADLRWTFISVDARPAFDLSAESVQGLKNQTWMGLNIGSTLVEVDRPDPIVWHMPSEGMIYDASQLSFRDADDQLWWIMRDRRTEKRTLYQLHDSRFVPWDEGLTGTDIKHDQQIKRDAKGQLWMLKLGQLYRYEKGLWRAQAKFSAPVPDKLMPTPSGRLFLGAPGSIYEWTAQGAELLYSIPGNQLYFSHAVEDGQGAIWFHIDTAVDPVLYRLLGQTFKPFPLKSDDPDPSFLSARIFNDRGRLVVMNFEGILGFDAAREDFVPVDPAQLSLPAGHIYSVHEISLQDTLVEAIDPDRSAVTLVRISRDNKEPETMPAPAAERLSRAFMEDRDGRLWAVDNDSHLLRLNAAGQWDLMLTMGEVDQRLALDGTFVVRMMPAPEGGLFLQIYDGPLLRVFP